MNYQSIFNHLKNHSWHLRSEPINNRIQKLNKLQSAISAYEAEIIQALAKDFKKSAAETLLTEIFPVQQEIKFAIKHLPEWTRRQKVSAPIILFGTQNFIQYEPRGTVLIISPWNYPFQLALAPIVAAVSAGNNLILKPSEFTPATNQIVKKIIQDCFTPDEAMVIEGEVEITTQLLELPFDHIFFTGSTPVGKIVMAAAAKNLASVTLELGGKSPTIVDATADLELAAQKIAWGKSVNAGQTCVAPDYIFAHYSIANKLKERIYFYHRQMYPDAIHNPDYAAIISERHYQRLLDMTSTLPTEKDQDIISTDKIPLQIFVNPPSDSKIMSEEIFGPLLPMITYENIHEVITKIRNQPKPLALYIFTEDSQIEETILEQTSSGGVLINDTLLHLGNHYLPFGGVGPSGLGNYHGIHGFKAFSHEKSVMRQSYLGRFLKVIYAPYTPFKEKLIRLLSKL